MRDEAVRVHRPQICPPGALLLPPVALSKMSFSPSFPNRLVPNPFHRLQSELMQLMVRWRPRDAARAVLNVVERRVHRRGAAVRTSACVHPLCLSWCSSAIIDRHTFRGPPDVGQRRPDDAETDERRSLTLTRSTWPGPSVASTRSGLAHLPRPLPTQPPHPQDAHAWRSSVTPSS